MSTMTVGSILAAGAAATQASSQPAGTDLGHLGATILLASVLIAVALFVILRAWDPSRIVGPIRYPLDQPALGPVLLAALAAAVFLGTQVAAGIVLSVLKMRAGERLSMATLSPRDYAFVATVPGLLASVILLLFPLLRRDLGVRLGMTWRQLPRGLILGVIAALISVPLVFGSSIVVELIYQMLNIAHPREHVLLAMMKSADSLLVRIALIAGATIIAPLVEELVFRAFIQSALVRIFTRGIARASAPPAAFGFPMSLEMPSDIRALTSAAPVPVPSSVTATATAAAAAKSRWVAILLTSLVFSLLHPPWSWPMIFLLSLCLGYAYERTGNIWASVTLHLLFNSASTAVFLLAI